MIYEEKEKLCKSPLVSTFVFTYNQQDLVIKTIESIVYQNCDFDYEIIICDDCSTDATLNVCLDYQKRFPEKVRVVENEKNLGIRGSYINNISQYTRGKYVASCAGDDWWSSSQKLQKQITYLENHEDVSLVHSHAYIYVDESKSYSKKLLGCNRNSFEDNVLANRVAALTICFKKQAFDEYVKEIDPISLPFSEDYPMVIWFSYRKKIGFISEPLCTYRLQTNSLSHALDKNMIYKGPKDVYDCKMVFIKKFRIVDEKLIKKIKLNYYFDRMRYGHLLGDEDNIYKGEAFFKEKHCYHYYLLSKLYRLAGKNEKANKVVFYFGVLLKKVFPIYK